MFGCYTAAVFRGAHDVPTSEDRGLPKTAKPAKLVVERATETFRLVVVRTGAEYARNGNASGGGGDAAKTTRRCCRCWKEEVLMAGRADDECLERLLAKRRV